MLPLIPVMLVLRGGNLFADEQRKLPTFFLKVLQPHIAGKFSSRTSRTVIRLPGATIFTIVEHKCAPDPSQRESARRCVTARLHVNFPSPLARAGQATVAKR